MIIAVIGKTSSGKDTAAKYIEESYGIPMVVSYATRPMRDYEIDGVHHIFVSPERMQEIKENETMLAYTFNKRTGHEYCATLEAVGSEDMVYIINPNGLRWMDEQNSGIERFSIYVDCNELTIRERGRVRGDDTGTLELRLNSERDEFDSFRDSGEADYVVENNSSLFDLLGEIDGVMLERGFGKKGMCEEKEA